MHHEIHVFFGGGSFFFSDLESLLLFLENDGAATDVAAVSRLQQPRVAKHDDERAASGRLAEAVVAHLSRPQQIRPNTSRIVRMRHLHKPYSHSKTGRRAETRPQPIHQTASLLLLALTTTTDLHLHTAQPSV